MKEASLVSLLRVHFVCVLYSSAATLWRVTYKKRARVREARAVGLFYCVRVSCLWVKGKHTQSYAHKLSKATW